MFLPKYIRPRLFAVFASSVLLASAVFAQNTAPKGDTNAVSVTPYRSAFDGYLPHTDEPIANWKAANDTTARIGGWREYARQAQQPDNTPTATPPVKAGPTAPQAKP